MARTHGRTVLLTIHQPSSRVMAAMDQAGARWFTLGQRESRVSV
jgi:hypothetical protein